MAEHRTALVVSHTHWDREWYLPFQRFRMKLVEMVDTLLDILDTEPSYKYFTLDGQTVVLEDYLEIRPENRERLAKHIRNGRILIGPWYVLPDEFLVSGESLVRNLLLGHLVAKEYGGVMPVGYLPDTFGHPSQIPQIFQGFGLDNAVIYRGVETDSSEFLWESPDGTSVLAVFLPGGYCNAMSMTSAPQRFLEHVGELVDKIKAMATTDTILLMNGCDHLAPRRELEQIIIQANQRLDNGLKLQQGTLPQYIERVKAANPDLKTLRGEFRRPRPGRVTPGVISSRMYLKLENFRSFTALEKYAEPIAALSWLLGESYPRAFLWQAWKYLLQNHPHDSICGCSVDSVHRDMMSRFRWTQEIADELVRRGLDALASRVDASSTGDNAAFIAFNPLGQPRHDYVNHYINFFEIGQEFHVRNHRGEVVPHQVINRKRVSMFYNPLVGRVELEGRQKPCMIAAPKSEVYTIVEQAVSRQWRGEEIELLVLPGPMPPCGFTTYSIVQGPSEPAQTDLRIGDDYLENDLIKVAVRSDVALDIVDKRTDTVYSHLNLFEDRGDCGDEYTYCPPEEDVVATSREFQPKIRLVENGPVRGTFEIETVALLPKALGEDRVCRSQERVGCPMTTRVSLVAGSSRVEVHVELMNLAQDNVLRVLFPTPIRTDWSNALGQFEVVKRPVGLPKEELERTPGPDEEVAVNTYPHHAFVDVNDGARGLAILSRGLTEYEVMPGTEGVTIALTLLRSVGWLSRSDLQTRYGHAGPGLPTPDAQCLGTHVFEYAILPHAGTWFTSDVQHEADRYAAPTVSTLVHSENGSLPGELGFITVEPSDLVMSALKKAESEDALILRLFNATANTVQAKVRLNYAFKEARLVNLAEDDIESAPLSVDNADTIKLEMRGYQICSIKFVKH